eukprot:gene6304-11728_t
MLAVRIIRSFIQSNGREKELGQDNLEIEDFHRNYSIDSCRHAQFLKFRREEKLLLKTLAKFDKEKSKHISEDEQFFLKYSPGDGVTMLSYSDLLSGDGEGKEEENQDFAQSDQEDLDRWEVCQDEIISQDEKKEEIEFDGVITDKKIGELHEELRKHSLGDEAREQSSSIGYGNFETHSKSSGQNMTTRGSHQNARRRFSLDSQDEVVPFYMKKKYDHHIDEQRRRLLGRRKTLTLEDERYLFEKQLMGPSADLGTVSFKSGVDRSWLNADFRKEREEALKRMSECEIEIACKQRPSSGLRRIRMALERLPNESPHLESPNSSSRAIHSKVQVTDSVESTKRRHPMLGHASTTTSKNAFEDKITLLNQRRHTIGEVPIHSFSTRKVNLENLKSFKSLRAIDCSDALSFEDKGIVFPAYEKDRSYSLKEFISLRKCRYLRLSRLNLESLVWQSKHQALLNY